MDQTLVQKTLEDSYTSLLPYSQKYTVDFDRYLFSLKLLTSIPDIKNKKVVDIGTGIALMPIALKKLGISANGLDRYIFPDAKNNMFGLPHISELQKIWSKEQIQVFNKDIYQHDLPQEIFPTDVILSEATIEHVKDPKKFLTTCHNLLSTNGYLLLTTPNGATLLKRLRFLFGKSPYWPIKEFFNDGESFTGHWREYTMDELVYMCETAGFTIIEKHTRNDLTKFKNIFSIRKNIRAFISLLSLPFSGMREMHFILCQKKVSDR